VPIYELCQNIHVLVSTAPLILPPHGSGLMRKPTFRRAPNTDPVLFSQTISAQNGVITHVEHHTSEPEVAQVPVASSAPAADLSPPPGPVPPGIAPADDDVDVNIHSNILPPNEPAPLDTTSVDDSDTEPVRTELAEEILHLIYSLEAPPESPQCQTCGIKSPLAFFRCKDCFGGQLQCNDCIRKAHFGQTGNPFHRVDRLAQRSTLEQSYFRRASLSDPEINGALHLGHHGSPCPHQNTKNSTICCCLNEETRIKTPSAHQFILAGLFPATHDIVRTAFTFNALRSAQLHQVCSGESMWDFYEVVRRWTNDVRPETVPDLYTQFRHALHLWRVILMIKHSGHSSLQVPNGALVVRCPTCPRVGVNTPPEWRDDPLSRLKYASMLAVDGNFHLHRNSKGKPDHPLTGNAGFWADDGEFDDYVNLKGARPDTGEKSIKCHSFKAGDPSRSTRKSGKSVTGVVMVSCSRHFFIQPNGTADLHKGERFAYVDVPLASVIRQQDRQQRHIHTYDIGCKYSINFKSRITLSSDGDAVDQEAASRGSLPSDVLIAPEDFPSDFEIKKVRCLFWRWMFVSDESQMAKRVFDAYFSAYQVYISKEAELKAIEDNIEPQKLESMQSDARVRGYEQFGPASRKGPSKSKVLIELKKKEEDESLSALLAEEDENIRRNLYRSGALFLSNAMDIEDLQYQLRTRNLDEFIAEGTAGADKRRAQHLKGLDALRRRADEHLEAYIVVAPGLRETSLGRAQVPTSQELYLPSSFSPEQREAYGLIALAKQEAELRIGNAHDYLSGLRDALGLRSLLVQAKKTHVRGHTKTTRAEASITRAGKIVKQKEAGYRRNWKAMKLLGVKTTSGEPGYGLQELEDNDIQDLQNFIESPQYDGDPAKLPWIWRSFSGSAPSTSSTSEVQRTIESWEKEVLRLTWTHAQASRDRWWEEHMLLRAESERVALSFRHAAQSWRAIEVPVELDEIVKRGIRAYGQKKGTMFDELANEAAVNQALIDKHWRLVSERKAESSEAATSDEEGDEDRIVFEDADDIY
ncbi:hypothetical protein FRC01_004391, partial [Tulasnella sp. 417]